MNSSEGEDRVKRNVKAVWKMSNAENAASWKVFCFVSETTRYMQMTSRAYSSSGDSSLADRASV